MGGLGVCGPRGGNFAAQKSDLVIAIGTRLSQMITGGRQDLFAPNAKKIMLDIDFEEILQLSAAHGESQPSVQFAIETALYDLESKLNNIPLNKLLNSQSSPIVKINYYDNSNIKPFSGMIIKLKVIDNNFFNQVDRINKILEKIRDNAKLKKLHKIAYP